MSELKTVTIKIDKISGKITSEVNGVKGTSCENIMNVLDSVLGKAENVKLKDSYYEDDYDQSAELYNNI